MVEKEFSSNLRSPSFRGMKKMCDLVREGLMRMKPKGGFIYVDKSINITNSNLKNSPVNSGKKSKQTVVVKEFNHQGQEDKELFDELLHTLDIIEDEDDKADAEENVAKLQDAVSKKNKSRAEKLFSWLPTAVQGTSVAVQIYKIIEGLPSGS